MKYSILSESRLQSCTPDLQIIFHEAIKYFDISILCGHRDRIEQNLAYKTGHSKVKFPNSKHNSRPSRAVDFAPFPDSKDVKDYIFLAGQIMGIAYMLREQGKTTHLLRYGGDFNRDSRVADGWDWGHLEEI